MIDDHADHDFFRSTSPGDSAADDEWFLRWAEGIKTAGALLGAIRGVQVLLGFVRAGDFGALAFLEASAAACFDFLLFATFGLAAAAVVRALGVWAESRTFDAQPRSLGSWASAPPPPSPSPSPAEAVAEPEAPVQLAEIRRLIRDHEWDGATDAVRAFRDQHPVDPRGVEASEELERTMQAALGRLEGQLQAAREVNDPDQVLEIHGRMSPLLKEESRRHLDVDLSHWFLAIVHRRLRSGRIQADVVELADRIAENFGHTTDGASLRASLPTLRRSAGLCPRCAKPYTGVARACPECLKSAPAPPRSVEPDELDEPPFQPREPDVFVEPSDESSE